MANTAAVLSDITIQKIRDRNPNLIGDISNGTRSVAWELLTPPTSSSTSSSTLPTGSSLPSASSHSVSIPHKMHSPETLQYLGFSPNVSQYLFGRYELRLKEVDEEEDMLSFVHSFLRYKCDKIEDSSEDWADALDKVGIHGQIRSALLHPAHLQIRGIQPLSSWLCEMVETNYNALVGLEDRILSNINPGDPNLRGSGFESDDTVPATLSEHINLFKSVSLERTRMVVAKDGTIDLALLLSTGTTDFARRGGLYFTHQMWVAAHYSRLISDACPVCDRRIIEIAVPLEHLKDENLLELDFGDTWKRLIYFSRRGVQYPKDLGRLRSEHGVIHGPIVHSANFAFGKMNNPDEIQKKHLLWENSKEQTGHIGKQHVWLSDEAVDRLSDIVRGKTWVRKPEQGYALVKSPWED